MQINISKRFLIQKLNIKKTNFKKKINKIFFVKSLKSLSNIEKSLKTNSFIAKSYALKKNTLISSNALKHVIKNKTFSVLQNNKVKSFFLKTLILNNSISAETTFFIKKLLKSFISKKVFIKKTTTNNQSIYNNICKNLFLLLQKGSSTNKDLFFIEKKVITFIFKNRINFKTNYQKYLYKKLVRSYLKQLRFQANNNSFCFFYKSVKKQIQSKITIKNLLHSKLVGIFLKNGKKATSLNIVNKALLLTALKLKRSPTLILSQVFNKLKTSVELKEVKIRKSTHLVPFPVNFKRKIFLLVKWLRIGTLKSNKKIKTIILKLHKELVKTLKTKYSLSYRIKKYHISKALLNKSNFHFRW